MIVVSIGLSICVLILAELLFSNYMNQRSLVSQNNVATNSLIDKLKHAYTIMWIGAHPDDELYIAGTLGYFTRDLHGQLIIVSPYYNPKFVNSNEESAKFLGNAIHIRIQEKLNKRLPRCRNWNQIESTALFSEALKQKALKI